MRKSTLRSAFAGALASVAAASAAVAAPLNLDMAQARSPAEKLVICDISKFLESDPNLRADVIYVRHESKGRFEPLLGPRFISAGNWYDEDYERAYRRLRYQGRASLAEVLDAQRLYGRQIQDTRRVGLSDRTFLRAQNRACRAWLRSPEVRG
jgi:hypothetical protein